MNYKEIIESRYNREAWQGLLHDIFHNNIKFWSNPIPIQVSSRLAKTALRLGNITLSDGETIAVYEVELNDKVDISRVDAIAFDPYTHGYYRVAERVGEAFRDGLRLKK